MVKLMHVVEEWAYTCASAVVPDLSPLQPTKAFSLTQATGWSGTLMFPTEFSYSHETLCTRLKA